MKGSIGCPALRGGWGIGMAPPKGSKTMKLKGKEKSWQEEPGELEEQRWERVEGGGGVQNLDDPAQF